MEILKNSPPLLEDFLLSKAVDRMSPNTIKEYGLDIQMFLRFVKRDRGGISPETEFDEIDISDLSREFLEHITAQDIDRFKAYLSLERRASPKAKAPGLSTTAINRKLCALRSFFRYLITKQGMLDGRDPTLGITSLKMHPKAPEAFSVEDAKQILGAIDGLNEARDYCIVLIALTCGLRVSEISGLDLDDVRYGENPHLVVYGKGGKFRNVPLSLPCLEALEQYLGIREKEYRPCERDSKALFLSRHHKRISTDSIQVMVKKIYAETGVADAFPHAAVHILRHTAATTLLRSGTNLRVIQDLLGHANLNTTQIYLSVDNEDISEAIHRSPFAEITKND